MSKKFIRSLFLAGGAIALAAMGTFSKPAVAGEAICDTTSTDGLALILDQQKPIRLNSSFFPDEENAFKQCQDAANLLRKHPGPVVLVAETLESGVPVICVREDEKAGCGELGRAQTLFVFKEDTNPRQALLDMLDIEDENPSRGFTRLFIPWGLLW